VRHGGVGDQFLHILLDHRHQRPVDDPDDGENRDQRRPVRGGDGEQGHGEPQETVRPHLQQDGRQDHRTRRGRLDVRVRQPRVEREHRHLEGEGEEEGREEPQLQVHRDRDLVELHEVHGVDPGHGVMVEVEDDESRPASGPSRRRCTGRT